MVCCSNRCVECEYKSGFVDEPPSQDSGETSSRGITILVVHSPLLSFTVDFYGENVSSSTLRLRDACSGAFAPVSFVLNGAAHAETRTSPHPSTRRCIPRRHKTDHDHKDASTFCPRREGCAGSPHGQSCTTFLSVWAANDPHWTNELLGMLGGGRSIVCARIRASSLRIQPFVWARDGSHWWYCFGDS